MRHEHEPVKVDADADPKPVRTLDRAAASKTIVEATLPSPVVSSPVAQSSPETRAESVPALADAAVRLLVPAPSVLERTPAFEAPTRAPILEAASMPAVATLLARQAFGSPAIDFALASVEQHVRTSGMAVLKLEALAIGPVAVEVAQHADGVSLNFTTATPEARLALTDAQPRLIAEARAAGIALLDTGVDQGARDRRPHRTGQRATPHRFIDATTRSSADRFA